VFTPVVYYGRFITRESIPDSLETSHHGGQVWPASAARWRAAYEVLYRNASDPELARTLRRFVNYGGPRRRGDNYNNYVVGHRALFGRGPMEPQAGPARKSR
jgi:hypothetical protein